MCAQKSSKQEKEYNFLVIEIKSYLARVGAAINYEVLDKHFANDQTPIYKFDTGIELSGVFT